MASKLGGFMLLLTCSKSRYFHSLILCFYGGGCGAD